PFKLRLGGRCRGRLRLGRDAESSSHLLGEEISSTNPGFGIGRQSGHLKRHFAGEQQRRHGPFQFVTQGLLGKLPGYPDFFITTVPRRRELTYYALNSADGKVYVDGHSHPDVL